MAQVFGLKYGLPKELQFIGVFAKRKQGHLTIEERVVLVASPELG